MKKLLHGFALSLLVAAMFAPLVAFSASTDASPRPLYGVAYRVTFPIFDNTGALVSGAAGHTLKVYLSNTAPNVATHTVKADIAEISAGNGYTAGGVDIQNDLSESGGTATATAVDVVITASGGSIGPFRYAIIYNDTPTTPADPLVAYYDYGSAITLADGESLTVDFGASFFTLA